jgi:molybdopterin synthase sulfur carrier subunit
MIKVLYFARLREALGTSEEGVEPGKDVASVADLQTWLRRRGDPWAAELDPSRRILAAVNQTMASSDTQLNEGDEVAFFPPVTGG